MAAASVACSDGEVKGAIQVAIERLGYRRIKPEQEEAIIHFIEGNSHSSTYIVYVRACNASCHAGRHVNKAR